VHVTDTAGLREEAQASDEVERIGMARSWESIGEADAIVFLHDLTRLSDPAYLADEARIAQRLRAADPQRIIQVFNKADCGVALPEGREGLCLSARSGQGLEALRAALLQRAGWQSHPEGVFIARTRHVQALRRCREHLEQSGRCAAQSDAALDLFAEELRLAHSALQAITGEFTADDLLGEIFGRFCIGK
jgi:tRNA modification GTPase